MFDQPHSGFDSDFRDRLQRGTLCYARCPTCGCAVAYTARLCPHHPGQAPQWLPASGRAIVHAVTVLHERSGPRLLVRVQLEESPLLLAAWAGNRAAPAIAEPVIARLNSEGLVVAERPRKL